MSEQTGFRTRVVEGPKRYHRPDGQWVNEAWWDKPEPPSERIPIAAKDGLISQVAEPWPGGKQSCVLASQLNACILRGLLTSEEAQAVQTTVAEDPEFKGFWRDGKAWGKDFMTWSSSPGDTAFVVSKILEKRMAFDNSFQPSEDMDVTIQNALKQGYAVSIADTDHARTAFLPRESAGEVFIFDAKYPQTTGFYPMSEISRFHSSPDSTVII